MDGASAAPPAPSTTSTDLPCRGRPKKGMGLDARRVGALVRSKYPDLGAARAARLTFLGTSTGSPHAQVGAQARAARHHWTTSP